MSKSRKKKKKPIKMLTIFVVASFLIVVIYLIVCTIGWFIYHVEPPTQLTTETFNFFGKEIVMTGGIKIVDDLLKLKKGVET